VTLEAATVEPTSATSLPAMGLKVKILERLRNGSVKQEFNDIKKATQFPQSAYTEANRPHNYRKNRYGNVLPLDKTRVKLSNTGVAGSDFINANYVDGWKSPKAFIATQAPVPTTVQDFWRMVWETNSGIIAMVTREVELGKTKCHKYWPDAKGTLQCGTLEISWLSQTDLSPDFSVRRFVLYNPRINESREISQFYYHAWPDQGVPEKPLSVLQYVTAINKQIERNVLQNRATGPVVVHCSAGIGRAGALIAIDISLKRLNDIGNIDVANTVEFIRTQRTGAVQTAEQYDFIYEAISLYPENRTALERAESQEGGMGARDIGLSEREKKALAQLSDDPTLPSTDQELLAALERI
jgi:protein tyrosine phosphatase